MTQTPSPNEPKPQQTLFKQMRQSAFRLSLYVMLGVGLLMLTYQVTKEDIVAAERDFMVKTIHQLLPKNSFNNALLEDKKIIASPLLGRQAPVTIYRARQDDQPVAVVFEFSAPDGYSGEIHLIIAVKSNGNIAGLRVLKHKETPGLGDKIEVKKSNWILSFNDKSLTDPTAYQWQVKKDGGEFDQFTGATITPRAVIKATQNALTFVNQQGESLYE